ncbi:hypothetical protein O6H91_23G027500 [Diphasiastrum complanatum]|uniref:Uncharacterized protein n=2 Tax=Diphasiastrum complanatum TaxID=34168 RepID=A0ACC2A948_DIPCM|nr:hypothetical protein O6H91_23G027500 [Diphasiastrum complanatum]KAJ7514095.1 hypothetical protein O6H91_23G027500 [Diphasiastrum complanatum]
MPYSEKKMSYSAVKVQKAPLVACLTCPLCDNLFRDATTISECLHTFCEECIRERLNDDEINECPICNAFLGCLPLEKLRVDNQLREVKAKLFPVSSRKRSMPSTRPSISVPVRRKERSLSSLGVVSMPPLFKPTTIVHSGHFSLDKSPTLRNLCIDGKRGVRRFKVLRSPEDAEKLVQHSHGKEAEGIASDYRKTDKVEDKEPATSREGSSSDSAFPAAFREIATVDRYAACHFKASVTKLSPVASGFGPQKDMPSRKITRYSSGAKYVYSYQKRRCRPLKVADLPPLAYLAEVGEADACSSATCSSADNALSVSLARKTFLIKGCFEEAHDSLTPKAIVRTISENSPTTGGSISIKTKNMRRANSQLHKRTSTGIKTKLEALKKSPLHLGFASFDLAPPNDRSTEVWFALKAAENQAEDDTLQQISTPYIRIKDGSLPVSHVKKYLAKKLHLGSDAEVEITCRGQPVVSSLPLESAKNIWLATGAAGKSSFSKQESTSRGSCNANQNGSFQDVVMILTYKRNLRTLVSH